MQHGPENISWGRAFAAAALAWLSAAVAALGWTAAILLLPGADAGDSLLVRFAQLSAPLRALAVFGAATLLIWVGAAVLSFVVALGPRERMRLCAGCALMAMAVPVALALAALLTLALLDVTAVPWLAPLLVPFVLVVSASDVWARAIPREVGPDALSLPAPPETEIGEGFVRHSFAEPEPQGKLERVCRAIGLC